MRTLRLWILGSAVGCFAAGMVVGHTFSHAADSATEDIVEQVRDLTGRYGLSADQQQRLHLVLQHGREREIAILRSAQVDQLPPPQMAAVLKERNATEQRLRKLLDDEQRERYDRESRPDPGPAAVDKTVERAVERAAEKPAEKR
jgi:hypothetical protein